MRIAFCFIAYGDNYVKEFLNIAPNFPKKDIIVTSDRQIKDFNTIIVEGEFNFHLRIQALMKAVKTYDSVLLLDTDNIVKNLDLNSFKQYYNKGLTVKWFGSEVEYLNESITSESLCKGLTSRNDVNNYGKMLFELNNQEEVKFIDESCFFFSTTDKTLKTRFIKTYKKLINQTVEVQPYRETDKTNGALEGCILYTAAKKSKINIQKDYSFFNDKFFHFGPEYGHRTNFRRRVI